MKMTNIKTLIIALVLVFPSSGFAKRHGSSYEELFSLANLALADGRYEESIDLYLGVEKQGIVNPDVYYNLGNAYFKMDQFGEAILYYEKGLKLVGSDNDIQHNLALAREQAGLEGITVDARSPIQRLSALTTFKGSADMTLSLYILTFVLLIFMVLSHEAEKRQKVMIVAILAASVTMLSGGMTTFKLFEQEGKAHAIITAETADLYEVPLAQSSSIGSVDEGVKVKLLKLDNGWLKVLTPGNTVGWIKGDGAGII